MINYKNCRKVDGMFWVIGAILWGIALLHSDDIIKFAFNVGAICMHISGWIIFAICWKCPYCNQRLKTFEAKPRYCSHCGEELDFS